VIIIKSLISYLDTIGYGGSVESFDSALSPFPMLPPQLWQEAFLVS